MACYLKENELTRYTNMPISMLDAENASLMIDSFKGRSFIAKEYTEQVKLNKKNIYSGAIYKGKLKHLPRCTITKIIGNIVSSFGIIPMEYNIGSIAFDEEESPYFTFMPQNSIYTPYPTQPPTTLTVTYTAGYSIDNIPEILKRATAQLATNLKLSGNNLKWSSKDDMGLKITLTKDGVFTNEIKNAIDLVRLS